MTYETTEPPPKALLVGIPLQQVSDQENEDSLAELSRLATTLDSRRGASRLDLPGLAAVPKQPA